MHYYMVKLICYSGKNSIKIPLPYMTEVLKLFVYLLYMRAFTMNIFSVVSISIVP